MPKYIALWNLPGCLPEMEPADFDTLAEAREFLADELESIDCTDHYKPFSPADDAYKLMADKFRAAVNPCVSTVLPNGYVYCIQASEWDFIDARIGSYFASYLINGDASGIDDSDTKALDQYCTRVTEGYEGGHWSIDGDDEIFATCDVTGLKGQCVEARYNFKLKA